MKKSIFIYIFAALIVVLGCNQKEKQQIARLTAENQQLITQSHLKDSSINDIFLSLNKIESNLAVIKEKEAVITMKSSGKEDVTPEVRTRINDDIKIINELMSKNKKEIARLYRLLKKSNLKNGEFEKQIAQLSQQIAQRDSLVGSLKDDLTKLHFTSDALNASLDTFRMKESQLKSTVNAKTVALNTAYFVTGTKKQLVNDNVISKEGGFVGIGRSNKLKQDFNDSKFQKVDIRQVNEIPLDSKKIQLVTTHPKGSYQIETNANGMVDKLKITDPDKFWSASKYLVVMVN
jgi:hypothetical protein